MYRFVEEGNKIKVLKRVEEGNYKVDCDIDTFEVNNIYLDRKLVNKKRILGDKYFSMYIVIGVNLYVYT